MGEAKRKKLAAQQQPPPKHKPGDAKVVLEAAGAFRECSRPFCTKMVNLPATANIEKVVKGDMGGMIASATNLAFAIERYIKALRIIHGQGGMGIHELDTFFQNLRAPLPPVHRQDVQDCIEADIRAECVGRGLDSSHGHATHFSAASA